MPDGTSAVVSSHRRPPDNKFDAETTKLVVERLICKGAFPNPGPDPASTPRDIGSPAARGRGRTDRRKGLGGNDRRRNRPTCRIQPSHGPRTVRQQGRHPRHFVPHRVREEAQSRSRSRLKRPATSARTLRSDRAALRRGPRLVASDVRAHFRGDQRDFAGPSAHAEVVEAGRAHGRGGTAEWDPRRVRAARHRCRPERSTTSARAVFGIAYQWIMQAYPYDMAQELAYVRERLIRDYGGPSPR